MGAGPVGVAYDSANGYVYVANGGSNNVSVISGSRVIANLPVGATPWGVAYDAHHQEIYVADWGGGSGTFYVTVINGTSDVTNITTSFARAPMGLAYDNHTEQVWATSDSSYDELQLLNGTTVGTRVGLSTTSSGVAYDTRSGLTYASDEVSGYEYAVSSSGAVTDLGGAAGDATYWVATDPATGLAYFADYGSGAIDEFNGTSYQNTLYLPTPMGMLAYDALKILLVSLYGRAQVDVLRAGTSIGTVPVGTDPIDEALDPVNGDVYVTNRGSNNVSIIDPSAALVSPLSAVSVSPSSATLTPGGAATFTATPSCSGGPCPSGTAYAWSMNRALGTFNSTTGSVVQFTAGATAGTTYLFVNATLNGVTVQSAAVPVTVTSGGPPHYTLGFSVHPTPCSITFNGTSQTSGSSGSYPAGTYLAVSNACPDFRLVQWNATGGVSILAPTALSTAVTISGNGTLFAFLSWTGPWPWPVTINFSASPASCPMLFHGASRANGTSATMLSGWETASAPACPGYAFHGFFYRIGRVAGLSGTTPLTLNWTQNGSIGVSYTPTGGPSPRYILTFAVSHAPCSPVVFNGSPVANRSSASFLAGTYPAHAPACAGYAFSDWTYQPVGGVNHIYGTAWANISIFANGTVTATYTPLPSPLTASLVANATSVVAGGSATLTPAIAGGVSPYSCIWSLNGTNTSRTGCAATSLGFAHPGTYTYRVWATDAAFTVAESNAVAITVSALPGPPKLVAFANASAPNTYIYEPCTGPKNFLIENLTGGARGGSPPYTFSWNFGDGSGHVVGPNVSHEYGPGSYRAELSVLDALGRNVSTNVTISIASSEQACYFSTAPSYLWVFVAAAVISLLLAVPLALLWRRRRGRGPPQTEPGPAAPLEERPPSP